MEEVSACLRMLDEVYKVFGLTYKAALSTRPQSYLGTLEQWDAAEAALRAALDQTGQEWEVRQDAESVMSARSGLSQQGVGCFTGLSWMHAAGVAPCRLRRTGEA